MNTYKVDFTAGTITITADFAKAMNNPNYIYYFAYKDTQEITTRERYLEAWHDYWGDISNGYCSFDAIWNMRANYGGVARKQAIPEVNGIYNEKIEQMLSYIQKSIENEMEG